MAEYQNPNLSQTSSAEPQEDFNIKDLIECCWRLKWWMAGAAILAVILAFCYVRTQIPTYERSTWIMLNKPDGSNTDLSILADLTGKTVTKKVDNEIFILKSPTLLSKVVEDLDLNTRYYHYTMPIGDRVRVARGLFTHKRLEYYLNNPFEMKVTENELLPDDMHPGSIYLEFKNVDGNSFTIRKLIADRQAVSTSKKTYK